MGFGPDLSDQVGIIQHGQLIMEGHALSGGLVVHAVQGTDGFSVLGSTHDDLAATDLIGIEGMQGLAVFE